MGPVPPLPLQATSLDLSTTYRRQCSSGRPVVGGGAGYPFGILGRLGGWAWLSW